MTEEPGWFAALRDRYRFEREIGRGGMAQVYLAEELRHGRLVAIKILSEELARSVGPDRFLREVSIAAQLNHPNILPLLDSGSIPAATGLPERPYYVMPYVAGESLRDRLARDPLELSEVLDIVRAVAGALDHAHGHRIVHRDIKPANILLAGGTAVVADFGIARALDKSASDESLTGTGLAIGTAQYMAPEQAGSGTPVDGRADIYALGCVVYEMLCRAPPFSSSNMLEAIAQHRLNPPPSVQTLRPELPPGVAAAVTRSLAKMPDARFESAGAFARALEDAVHVTGSGVTTPRAARFGGRFRWRWAALASVLALVSVAAVIMRRGSGPGAEAADTTRYAILPLEQVDSGRSALVEGLLRDAFARWSGISVADGFQVRDQLARRHLEAPRSIPEAASIAEAVGAGRLVRSAVSRVGERFRIEATLFDTRSRAPLATEAVTLDSLLGNAQVAIEALADSLLLRGTASTAALGALPGAGNRYGTRSVPALRAFWEGQQALQAWELATADSAFSRSVIADGQFSQAALWLALVRSWTGLPAASWSSAAQQAWGGRDRLNPRDQVIASALVSRAAGRLGAACPRWDSLAHAAPRDFVNWYGLGDCLASDEAVLRDPASASGWRFRTSYHAALTAYRQAYLLVPSILMALRDRDFQSVRRLYKTSSQSSRMGRTADGSRFLAVPAWAGDSLALVPWPLRGRGADLSQAIAPPHVNQVDAVTHQRQMYYQTVSSWVTAYPDNPDALAALAQAREMLADPTALQAMQRARRLATTPADRLQMGTAVVRLQVKQASPDDTAGIALATMLADSLLRATSITDTAGHFELASIAALTGRATAALQHLRSPGVGTLLDAPPGLSQMGPALELLAAFGGPRDSLVALEFAVRDRIENQLVSADRPSARLRWLARPATLAYPDYISPQVSALRGQGDYFLDAIAAVSVGDTAAALTPLDAVAKWRVAAGDASVSVDQLPALASVYELAGRRQDAVQVLDATLLHLFGSGPEALNDPVSAASLGRAMALRAELGWRVGDTASARRWARALEILWQNADSALQPVVRRMHRLASGDTNAAQVGGSTRRR
jgi:hypothetical protein